jgi:hypothetical protein
VRTYICGDIVVSSPLRSLWELEVLPFPILCLTSALQVAEIFCSPPLAPFLSVFLSCKDPKVLEPSSGDWIRTGWCNSCEKCVFVFLLLSAFLSPPQLLQIFGADLFSLPSLEPVFLAVLGRSPDGVKPFECIGTAEESLSALKLAVKLRLAQPDHLPFPQMLLRLCARSQVAVDGVESVGGDTRC